MWMFPSVHDPHARGRCSSTPSSDRDGCIPEPADRTLTRLTYHLLTRDELYKMIPITRLDIALVNKSIEIGLGEWRQG